MVHVSNKLAEKLKEIQAMQAVNESYRQYPIGEGIYLLPVLNNRPALESIAKSDYQRIEEASAGYHVGASETPAAPYTDIRLPSRETRTPPPAYRPLPAGLEKTIYKR